MTIRTEVDPTAPETVARAWNGSAGRMKNQIEVAAGEKPCLCYVSLSGEFLTAEERASLAAAIKGLHPAIVEVELQSEVEVPAELDGRQWVYQLSSHLRSVRLPVANPQA